MLEISCFSLKIHSSCAYMHVRVMAKFVMHLSIIVLDHHHLTTLELCLLCSNSLAKPTVNKTIIYKDKTLQHVLVNLQNVMI